MKKLSRKIHGDESGQYFGEAAYGLLIFATIGLIILVLGAVGVIPI